MNKFKLLNNVFGWLAFAIAAATYLSTMEPTASFWDCGEFISSAYKLDVGHPPGAPFFMLTGRFFSLFASDPTQVALMVNSLSALASAFTILFLFWTITHLARKIVAKSEEEYTLANIIGILGAGMVGALAYTFSDTFWFSAVEGEVYAYSSFFTAIVFWAILKWERVADKTGSDKWLIFIAYLMGLSIGVHLLNLLAIPAIALVYYFRNYKVTAWGVVGAMLTSFIILGTVLYGIIPGFVEVASQFELLFVNVLGFSFNTGLLVYIIVTLAILVWSIYETSVQKSYVRMAVSFITSVTIVGIPFFGSHFLVGFLIIVALSFVFFKYKSFINPRWLNTAVAMIAVILIGYSSYTVIVIRSAANPPMDQNSPDNVFALKYYLNREQYGDRPLIYGPSYNAPVKLDIVGNTCVPKYDKGDPSYAPLPKNSPDEKDKYFVNGYKMDYQMDDRFMMLFPRVYSSNDPQHITGYKSWADIKGKRVRFEYCGQDRTEYVPTFIENMRFFFNYQVNFMYFRYFMWNFSGRQNDIQGHGEIDRGNWISGIKFIDKILVGEQDNLPSELMENKARNKYYMLPFLLGILGILFLINSGKEGKHSFWITALLFFLTGIAIVIYLNQTPYQPRERDYAYAGSFYAFSIWIGLGVLGVIRFFEKYLPKTVVAILASVVCLGVPVLMASENWDDHDRSNRFAARDFGYNYLVSCKSNAIIFSNGDNDTFPLWYNQEVEGVGTDIRVCNLSYLQTDWYIDQMKRGAYKSAPLPISWTPKDYVSGKNEVVTVREIDKNPMEVQTAFNIALNPEFKVEGENVIPSKQLYINIDREDVLRSGTLDSSRINEVIPRMMINLDKSRLTKSELMVIEMLKENKWKRPMYFAVTIGEQYHLGLADNLELTGLAYQIMPTSTNGKGNRVNTKEMYNNMMTKFRWGNVADPNVYLDENTQRMCRTHRMMFGQLIGALIEEGDSIKALKALDFSEKVIPGSAVRHDYTSTLMGEYYYTLKEFKKGNDIMDFVANDCVENLTWYYKLTNSQRRSVENRIGHNFAVLNHVLSTAERFGQKDLVAKYYRFFEQYSQRIR
ncbi:MAG: DUF2723 domain-containing protein, partial [Pedobacter sp.]|nr:DUF2723 domain-containing protein [Pedobacter sp.]